MHEASGRITDELCNPEIHHLHDRHRRVFVHGQEYVRGLQIAMDHAAGVSVSESACGLIRDPNGLGLVEPNLAVEALFEIFAREQLHHDEESERFVLAGVEDLNDVIALDRGRCARFLLQSPDDLRVVSVDGVHELHSDAAAYLEMLSGIDGAHPALADHIDQPITAFHYAPDKERPRVDRCGQKKNP